MREREQNTKRAKNLTKQNRLPIHLLVECNRENMYDLCIVNDIFEVTFYNISPRGTLSLQFHLQECHVEAWEVLADFAYARTKKKHCSVIMVPAVSVLLTGIEKETKLYSINATFVHKSSLSLSLSLFGWEGER